jgi:hypothetical protein
MGPTLSFYWYGIAFLVSGIKFVPGVVIAMVNRFEIWEQFFITAGGGITGVIVFTYFGSFIGRLWRVYVLRKESTAAAPMDTDKWYVKVWQRYGIWGTAFLTPPILSPPIGTSLALFFGTPKHKIVLIYAISMLIWAVVFAFLGKTILNLFN